MEDDRQAITEAIARSIKKDRKVTFRLFTRPEQERGKFQFILECWTPKRLKKGGKSGFEMDGCEVVDLPAKLYTVDENQTFKLQFEGNCRRVSKEMFTKVKNESDNEEFEDQEEEEDEEEDNEDNDFVILDFVGRKGYSFTIVDMIVLDTEEPSGKMIIEKEIRTIKTIKSIFGVPRVICIGNCEVVSVEDITVHYEYVYLTEIEFEVKLPPPPKPVFEHNIEKWDDKVKMLLAMGLNNDTELSYSVLYPTSIVALCNCLSMEEAGLFGLQLGLPPSIREVLLESRNPPKELTFRLLQIWNGSKHCPRRVKKIQEALRRVDRDDLADAFGVAFVNKLPFTENTPSSLSKKYI